MKGKKSNEVKGGRKTDYELVTQIIIISLLALVITFNAGRIYASPGADIATGISTVSASKIIPIGTPAVYGEELGINYDDVSANNPQLADATINKLSTYEDKDLTQTQKARYIAIASAISCEYCCGVKAIIYGEKDVICRNAQIQQAIEDGQISAEDADSYKVQAGAAACGCAHSYAMRGLAKYLLINHPEMTDDEILSELGKWKVLFFPGIHEQKAKVLESQGIDSKNYINLASNLYRGIEKGQTSGGEMVGGC